MLWAALPVGAHVGYSMQVVALFSATLPESVEELARGMLRDPVRVTVGQRNAPASAVKQRLVYVGQEAGKLMALRDALHSGLRAPILVFVNSRQRATILHRCTSFTCCMHLLYSSSTDCTLLPSGLCAATTLVRQLHGM